MCGWFAPWHNCINVCLSRTCVAGLPPGISVLTCAPSHMCGWFAPSIHFHYTLTLYTYTIHLHDTLTRYTHSIHWHYTLTLYTYITHLPSSVSQTTGTGTERAERSEASEVPSDPFEFSSSLFGVDADIIVHSFPFFFIFCYFLWNSWENFQS